MNKTMETRELSQKVYDVVVDRVNALYPQFLKRVNDIDVDYFDKIACDSEKIPEELNLELRDEVLADMRNYAMELLEASDIKSQVDDMTKGTDQSTRKEVLDGVKQQLREFAHLSSGFNGSSVYTEEILQEMYADAKKRDFWERVTRTNKNDVIEFHHALMDKTYEQCKDVMYECVELFL